MASTTKPPTPPPPTPPPAQQQQHHPHAAAAAAALAAPSGLNVSGSLEDFQRFISFILSISIFGASTFVVIVGQMADPADVSRPAPPRFALATVRVFLALAWLGFILALGVAAYALSFLSIWMNWKGGRMDEGSFKAWDGLGIAVSALLYMLISASFVFLSLAMVAYVPVVGWVAVGFSSLFVLVSAGMVALQYRTTKS